MTRTVELQFKASVGSAVADIDKVNKSLVATDGAAKKSGPSLVELQAGFDLAGQAIKLAGQAIDATVTPTIKLAEEQRNLARASGTTAEEAGVLIQASDDLGISFETLQAAAKKANAEGFSLSIDSIKSLAAEYRTLPDPVSRAQLATEKFGRAAGPEMQKLLELTDEQLEALAEGARESGLVLSNEAVAGARQFEIAQDSLNDSIEAVKISIGQKLVPALTELSNFTTENVVPAVGKFFDLMDTGVRAGEQLGDTIALMTIKWQLDRGEIDQSTASARVWLIANEDNIASLQASAVTTDDYAGRIKAVTTTTQDFTTATDAQKAAQEDEKKALQENAAAIGQLSALMAGAVGNELADYADKTTELKERQIELTAEIAKYEVQQGTAITVTQEATVSDAELQLAAIDLQHAQEKLTEADQSNTEALLRAQVEVDNKRAKLETLQGQVGSSTTVTLDYSTKLGELHGQLGEVNTALGENASAHEDQTRRILFGITQQQLAIDGYTTDELRFLNDLAEKWGLVDTQTATATDAIISSVGAAAESGNWDQLLADIDGIDRGLRGLPPRIDINVHTSFTSSGTPGPGGGGGGAPSPAAGDVGLPGGSEAPVNVPPTGGGGGGAPSGGGGGGTPVFAPPGGVGMMQHGGPVLGGRAFLVGEAGPELFVPERSGQIVPNQLAQNDQFSTVINIDARGAQRGVGKEVERAATRALRRAGQAADVRLRMRGAM